MTMFDGIFNIDGPVARFIFRVRDLFLLNLVTLVCMIPVFTFGPALKALAFTCLKIVRGDDGNILKTYFANFRLNFRQSVLFGLVCLFLTAVGVGDILALWFYRNAFPVFLMIPAIVALLIVFGILVWAIPMQARFLNPVKDTFKNAFWAMLVKLAKTLLMLISFTVIPSLYLFLSGNFFPLVILFGLSFPAYLNAILYEPFFDEIEKTILNADTSSVTEDE